MKNNKEFKDPYLQENYVLKNKFNIKNKKELEKIEIKYCFDAEFNFMKRYIHKSYHIDSKTILEMHFVLFNKIYDFAGKIRTVNISKGTSFAPVQFIESSLDNIWNDFEQSLKTRHDLLHYYRELNFIHPFREGNGRSGRLLLQFMYKKYFNKCLDFTQISKNDYMNCMIDNSLNPNNENLNKLVDLFNKAEIEIEKVSDNIISSTIHESLQYEYDYDVSPYIIDYIEQDKDNILEKEQKYKKSKNLIL